MQKEIFVIRYRWPLIIACLLLTAVMGWQLRKLEINADFMFMFNSTMASRMNTEKIEKVFGSSDVLFILVEGRDVLDGATLRRVKTISQKCKKVAGVKMVMSLFDTKNITSEEGVMMVDPAVGAIPANDDEREALRKSLSENELAREMVVSKDFRATAILLNLNIDASKPDVYKAAKKAVAASPGPEKVLIGGIPAFQTVIIKNVVQDILILVPGALLVILAILYGFFRQKRGIVLPLGVVFMSVMFGMGFLPLMGWKMTLLSAILPVMVIAFSNNYCIYLIARYKELCATSPHLTKKQIATEVFRGLYQPILFSGLTTMVGLLGMLSHEIVPIKQMGVAASIAIGFSIFASIGGLPAVLSFMKLKPAQNQRNSLPFLDTALQKLSSLVTKFPKALLVATAVIIVIGAGFSLRVNVDANQENLFGKKHPVNECTRLINKHFGGSQNVSVLFEADVKDPRFLNKLESYKDSLQRLPGVGQITSMADVIRIMSKALNDTGDSGYNRIPESREAVAQYLELYSMNGNPDDFENLVDFNYEKTHFIVRIKDGATTVVKSVVDKILDMSRDDKEMKAVGGWAAMYVELAQSILRGQITSILFALIAIIMLVMVMFRSVSAGLLSSLPLLFAVITGFGVMGMFNINLDIATAIITSIVIGTGVDFTLQFLWRYRGALYSGATHEKAIKETFSTVGRAIVFNAFCITSGLGIMILSSIPPLRYFAILFGVLTISCMVGSLIVIPAACVVWKPKFLEPRKENS
jgi:hydrophobe/amphiphile efflux-3 (HAE3) family protein